MSRLVRASLPALCLVFGLLAMSGGGAIAGEPAPGGVAGAPPGVAVYQNIQYADASGQALLLDAYIPGGSLNPAVVLIHGGAWAYGDKRSWTLGAEKLAAAGFAAFSINYRLSPPHGDATVPAAIDDVHAAIAWVRANAASYGVDPTRVGALGDSAGGNLALMAATTGQAGADRADAAASWSGPTELAQLADLSGHGGAAAAVRNYVGCAPADCGQAWSEASPLEQVTPSTAPVFLANSTDEIIPLSQAQEMANALAGAGVPYVLQVVPGTHHAMGYARLVWNQTLQFLETYLSPAAPGSAVPSPVGPVSPS